ncbi:hypothetical protein Sde_2331 [Saccharophagus degradans 2-40]|uniref:Uncharacterized protein n=1 Tax=Saccharophagus degradans (strain 2-40 / ATCC 43961 / DSM 17024) TaxID=203122 RepID=Q21I88_SACD2|nr:hypothetical protein Sde_2331 [Saccharophagus degradans 2-40]
MCMSRSSILHKMLSAKVAGELGVMRLQGIDEIKILKIFARVVLILFGLYLLNGAVFGFWAASGPPTDTPEYFEHIGVTRLSFAIACFSAIALVGIRLSDFKRQKLYWAPVAIIVVCVVYPKAREQIHIDSCLDQGGSWQVNFKCQK